MQAAGAKNIDDYIAACPAGVQKMLKQMRTTIRKAAPQSEEAIKYGIPTFVLDGNLVHFAAYKNHIGFYPAPSAMEAFKKEFAAYKTSKGAVQFPLDHPLPLDLVAQVTEFRVEESLMKHHTKKGRQSRP